jgi:hypothetical protein
MTKAELLAILYERLNYQTSPASTVTTRLGNLLNEVQRSILRRPGIAKLRDTATGLTFASVANQSCYGLPPVVSNVKSITDRTNDRDLEPLSVLALRKGDPGLDATGTPYGYVPFGIRPILMLPAATGLWVASSSASDTTQVAQVNGVRTGGIESGDAAGTLSGLTRVAIGGAGAFTDYVDVLTFTISAVGVGVITLYDAATLGNTLAVIPIGRTSQQYWLVQLYPTPDAANTYYVDGKQRAPEMDDTVDVPVLPEEFHDLLIHGALMREYLKQSDPRYREAKMLFDEGVKALEFFLTSPPGEIPVLGRPAAAGRSRLGSWYPAE